MALILNGRVEARLDAFRTEFEDRLDSFRAKVEAKLTGLRSELISRIERVSDDQKQCYTILGEHKEKIESLEKR